MKSPGTYASLWTRSGLWGVLAVTGIVGGMSLKKSAERAQQTAALLDVQSAQLRHFQSEEAAFEKRLSAAGLSLTAFESDAAVVAQPFVRIAQLLEQEFPTTKIRFQISPQPPRPSLEIPVNKKAQQPFTTEAIEQASALSFTPISHRSSERALSSAQGVTVSNALTTLTFSIDLVTPKGMDVFILLNRMIHLVPGVITFDHIDLHRREWKGGPSDPTRPNGASEGYEANVRGRIATHSDEARILLGA